MRLRSRSRSRRLPIREGPLIEPFVYHLHFLPENTLRGGVRVFYTEILRFLAILSVEIHHQSSLVQPTSGPSEYSSEASSPHTMQTNKYHGAACALHNFQPPLFIASDLFLINSRQSQWRGQTRTRTCCTGAWATRACTYRPLDWEDG